MDSPQHTERVPQSPRTDEPGTRRTPDDESESGAITSGRAAAGAERKRLEGQLRQIDSDLNRLVACITPETAATLGRKMRELETQRAAAEGQLAALRPREIKGVPSRVTRMLDLACDLRRLFELATPQEKKQFIDLLVDEIHVNPTTRIAVLTLTPLAAEMRKAALEGSRAALPSSGSGGGI